VTPSTDAVETAACPEQTIIDAAVEEGQVNLIALPDNWANYKGILQAFRDKYPGVNNPVANPDASSADELTAVKTLAGQPDMPDALDVSPAIAQQVADEGLWAPYKPCAWDEIPDNLKDRELGRCLLRHHGHRHEHHDREGRCTEVVRRPEGLEVQGPDLAERRSS
jgi:putative spermidine/putrescine transport system substrate-binding protein